MLDPEAVDPDPTARILKSRKKGGKTIFILLLFIMLHVQVAKGNRKNSFFSGLATKKK